MAQIFYIPLLLLVSSTVTGSGAFFSSAQREVVASWLAQHPEYRAAEDKDCECAEDIAQLRAGNGGNWTAAPDYHPYRAVGDFNGDGAVDFALVVLESSKAARQFTVLVFNAPYDKKAVPIFLVPSLDLL